MHHDVPRQGAGRGQERLAASRTCGAVSRLLSPPHMITTRPPASPMTQTMPTTTVSVPTTAQPTPQPHGPLQVKDGFETGQATKKPNYAVKTDAINTVTVDANTLKTLRDNLAAAKTSGDSNKIKAAYEALGQAVFGQPVNVVTSLKDAKAGKINVVITSEKTSGWTVPEGKDKGETFSRTSDPKPTIAVNASLLEKQPPHRAQKVLFHEGQHLAHSIEAQELYGKFKGAKSKLGFEEWLVKSQKLSPARAELLQSVVDGRLSGTESVAHVESFIVSFKKFEAQGFGKNKAERFMNEGAELLALEDAGGPKDSLKVKEQERKNLFAFYKTLTPDQKTALINVLKDLKAAQPNNFLTAAGGEFAALTQ